ncbi:MAG: HupE/UreJ family protein [Rhodospirillaceae bacterium]|nr:HupE/UreJ family protein [Rhodospirillaceae bacterium]
MLHNGLTKLSIALLVFMMLAAEAAAHPMRGWHPDHSFVNGFLHPWQGIDHLVTMIGIGIWASQSSRDHPRWLQVAGIFSGTMAAAFFISYKYELDLGNMVESSIGIGLHDSWGYPSIYTSFFFCVHVACDCCHGGFSWGCPCRRNGTQSFHPVVCGRLYKRYFGVTIYRLCLRAGVAGASLPAIFLTLLNRYQRFIHWRDESFF